VIEPASGGPPAQLWPGGGVLLTRRACQRRDLPVPRGQLRGRQLVAGRRGLPQPRVLGLQLRDLGTQRPCLARWGRKRRIRHEQHFIRADGQ